MGKASHGCACCGTDLGNLFAANKHVRQRSSSGPAAAPVRPSAPGTLGRRDFLKGTVATAASGTFLPSVAQADTQRAKVFTGGTILTVDADFSEAEALAIRGNRIIAVGTDEAVRAAAGSNAEIIDLYGMTMLPGFVDAHTHVVSGSVLASLTDYVGIQRFRSTQEVLDHIAAVAAKARPGDYLAFRNYDPSLQTGPDAIGFAELDPIAPHNPVFVLNASGHLGYANRQAFSYAKVPEDVPDPPGAEFVRDLEGRLTGVMKNNTAWLQVFGPSPMVSSVNPADAIVSVAASWSRVGLTTASELSLGSFSHSPADIGFLEDANRSGRLNLRVRTYPFYTLGTEVWDKAGVTQGMGNDKIRVAGFKLIADGSNQGYTGLQREPYLGTDSRGLAYTSREELTRLVMDRASKGWGLAIHGNGDAAIDNILDALEQAHASGIDIAALRPRIEHCSILHDGQIKRIKALGANPSFLIGHVYYWGAAFRDDIFGTQKAWLLDRCGSCERVGVPYSLHSDFFVLDPDPLLQVGIAVTRNTFFEPDYVLNPDERASVENAIRGVTSEAAWQLFSDHEVGSLEVGKLADMVILEADPRTVAPSAIKNIRVMQTWFDGRQVYAA
ncbi:amidohydrolase [Marinibaculum pumilum]|uniref:Amidohydrolase n=1 Tax=Marinibaculum pumilum TaxID=1766165 RepID=A0ABV7L5S9_9PROT